MTVLTLELNKSYISTTNETVQIESELEENGYTLFTDSVGRVFCENGVQVAVGDGFPLHLVREVETEEALREKPEIFTIAVGKYYRDGYGRIVNIRREETSRGMSVMFSVLRDEYNRFGDMLASTDPKNNLIEEVTDATEISKGIDGMVAEAANTAVEAMTTLSASVKRERFWSKAKDVLLIAAAAYIAYDKFRKV